VISIYHTLKQTTWGKRIETGTSGGRTEWNVLGQRFGYKGNTVQADEAAK